jgi:subtilisin family serine protease
MGVTGEGVVIGGQDTGYEWTHPALQPHYRGWDGTNAEHNYNWHDAIHEDNPNTAPGNSCGFDLSQPCDDSGHGTHTLGPMVGDDSAGNQIGVAPNAKWIGCRNMEQRWGTPASYSECYEWFIAPYPLGGDSFNDGDPTRAPHVINNSWGCPQTEGCIDPNILRAVVNNVRAAGIVTVNSAGNTGSHCSSVNDPAAIYDASFTVGATQGIEDSIASFSSRGPVLIGGNNPAKPDITAPGVSIRTSTRGGGYGTASGTSFAAPHVTGVTALLISANPALAGNVDLLEKVMMETAVPRTTTQGCGGDGPEDVPNHVYGWGRIDAWTAYETVLATPNFGIGYLPLLLHE